MTISQVSLAISKHGHFNEASIRMIEQEDGSGFTFNYRLFGGHETYFIRFSPANGSVIFNSYQKDVQSMASAIAKRW